MSQLLLILLLPTVVDLVKDPNLQGSLTGSTTVSVSSSAQKVQVAEPFTVTIQVEAPTGTNIQFPPIENKLGPFDIIDSRTIADVPITDNNRQWIQTYLVDSITTGENELPVLEIQATLNGKTETLRTKPLVINVLSVLEDRADPTKFRDIRSVVDLPVAEPKETKNWGLWIGCGALALALAGAAVVLVNRRRRTFKPADWASEQLQALGQSQALQQGDSITVTTDLTEILRTYLALQFELPELKQTTDEILATLENRSLISADRLSGFKEIFEQSDLVKFAGLKPTETESRAEIERAHQLIRSTEAEIAQGSTSKERM